MLLEILNALFKVRKYIIKECVAIYIDGVSFFFFFFFFFFYCCHVGVDAT